MTGTFPFEPPRRLVGALAETYGEASDDWLGTLGGAAARAAERHALVVERVPAPGGRSSLVVLVHYPDGTPAALKLAPPAARPDLEAAALTRWNGWGAVRLLEPAAQDDADALVLERLQPDVSLRSLAEAKALLEAAGTLRRLWVEAEVHADAPDADGFETVTERTGRQAVALRDISDELVRPLVTAALDAREALTSGPDADAVQERFLLHGCFSQGKVLAGQRTPWLAVGPDPLVGDRAYDLARLSLDRVEDLLPSSGAATTARRRVARLADSLDLDRERVRGWALFRAVASGVRAGRLGRRRASETLLEFASWL